MKILIELPQNIYESVKKKKMFGYLHFKNIVKYGLLRFNIAKAIENGIPIDDIKVKADMENMERAYQRGRLDATIDKYWKDVAKDIGVSECR